MSWVPGTLALNGEFSLMNDCFSFSTGGASPTGASSPTGTPGAASRNGIGAAVALAGVAGVFAAM